MSRVIQRGQPYRGEMAQAFAYTYQPFLQSNPQPAAHPPNFGQFAVNNSHLMSGLGAAYPGSAIMPTLYQGLGRAPAIQPAPAPAVSWAGVGNAAVIQQGPQIRIPSGERVIQDAVRQPNSRSPMLYGRSLGQTLADVYRW